MIHVVRRRAALLAAIVVLSAASLTCRPVPAQPLQPVNRDAVAVLAPGAAVAGELVQVRAEPVLPACPGSRWRADAGNRFFELSFHLAKGEYGPVGSVPAVPRVDNTRKQVGPDLLRVCRPDLFFVDLPRITPLAEGGEDRALPSPGPEFGALLSRSVAGWIHQSDRHRWLFAHPDDARTDPMGTPPSPPGFCGEQPQSSARLAVREVVLCQIVGEVRRMAMSAYRESLRGRVDGNQVGRMAKLIRVGRMCTFGPQGVQQQACGHREVLDWHLRRMGVSSSGAGEHDAKLELALIDTGLEPGFPSVGLEARPVWAAPGLKGQRVHEHGTHMALLARQLAPDRRVKLSSYRIFNQYGESTPNLLARALDHALFPQCKAGAGLAPGPGRIRRGRARPQRPVPPSHPIVVNLSLGWPPELTQPRRLTGYKGTPEGGGGVRWESCTVTEAGVGAPVDFLLQAADQVDRSGERSVLVVAAAGNRPDPYKTRRRGSRFGGAFGVRGANAGDVASSKRELLWFYPAQYARERWRLGAAPVAVGAVDDRDMETVLSIPAAEPALVAPGQHVYTKATNRRDACEGGPLPSDACPEDPKEGGCDCPGLHLPSAITGTSVATALVSGAAARAQLVRLSRRQKPLSGRRLARLLYLSAEPMARQLGLGTPAVTAQWRPAVVGTRVRRLSVGHLDRWLADPRRIDAQIPKPMTTQPLSGLPGAPASPPTGWTPPDPIVWRPNYGTTASGRRPPGRRPPPGLRVLGAPWDSVTAGALAGLLLRRRPGPAAPGHALSRVLRLGQRGARRQALDHQERRPRAERPGHRGQLPQRHRGRPGHRRHLEIRRRSLPAGGGQDL